MKELFINNKVVTVYDSIDELPIINFQKYNKYLLIDSGIGADIDAIDSHIAKLAKYIKINETDKAISELQNLRQNLFMINCEISPKYLAFAALIHSIDGKKSEDLSDEGFKKVLASLKEVPHSVIFNFLLSIKKKFRKN